MERYLTPDEQHRLLEAAHQCHDALAQRDYHIMAALLLSGCRVGEFCKITIGAAIEAIHNGALLIPKEDRKGKHRDHRIPVTKELKRHLTWLLSLTETGHESDPLIPGLQGFPITTRSIQLRIRYWSRRAGFTEDVTPHWLRHSRAMNIMRGSTAADPRGVVQQVLGHSSIQTTGIYTQTNKEDVQKAVEEVDKIGVTAKPRRKTLKQLRAQFDAATPTSPRI